MSKLLKGGRASILGIVEPETEVPDGAGDEKAPAGAAEPEATAEGPEATAEEPEAMPEGVDAEARGDAGGPETADGVGGVPGEGAEG